MTQMYEAIRRFETDLITGLISHDDCPTTAVHIANARKVAKPGQKYVLGKPNESQKIDLAMATVLVHEAAADARAAGWSDESDDSTVLVFR
jgi:phage terminase large subunit-like protein